MKKKMENTLSQCWLRNALYDWCISHQSYFIHQIKDNCQLRWGLKYLVGNYLKMVKINMWLKFFLYVWW